MLGGYHHRQLGQCGEAIRLIEHDYLTAIHGKGCDGKSLKVVAVWSQVVGGTNWWFHVTTDTGSKWSVCMFEPLPHTGNPCEIKRVQKGHINAGGH